MIHIDSFWQALCVVAAALSWWRSRRSPSWRPVAITLGGSVLVDLAAVLRLPARADLALWLATPVLSAWCSWRVLVRAPRASWAAGLAWLVLALAVGLAPAPSSWWEVTPLLVRLASIALQVEAARAWWRSRRVGTTVDAAAVVLLCGDIVSLLGPAGIVAGPWDIASTQGGVVAAGVVALIMAGGTRSGARR